MRLVGGTTRSKGRVEVYRNGFWGTICKDGWNIPDASVVCRMLGYTGAWTAGCCTDYPGGTGPVWLSDLSCTGEEKSLTECGHSGWGINDCDHGKDVEVICHSPPTEKPSGLSSAVAKPTIQTSQFLLPSGTASTIPTKVSSIVHSTVKSTTIHGMSPSLYSSTITPHVQKTSFLRTPSTQVSSTSTSFSMFQKASSSSSLFTTIQTSQFLLPSGTASTIPTTVSSIVHSTVKSTAIHGMSPSLFSSTITPNVQKTSFLRTPSTQVSSTSTSFSMSQKAPSSSSLFAAVVPSVVSPSSSSVVVSSSINRTLPPGM